MKNIACPAPFIAAPNKTIVFITFSYNIPESGVSPGCSSIYHLYRAGKIKADVKGTNDEHPKTSDHFGVNLFTIAAPTNPIGV